MSEIWLSDEKGTQGLLVHGIASDGVLVEPNTSRRLNQTARLLTRCLSLPLDISTSLSCGIYVVTDGDPDPNDIIGSRPLDYFKCMPGLTGPLALHEMATPSRNGPTFTLLGRQFGFLQAIDQLALDLSESRVDGGLCLYAHSEDPIYAFALYTRSKTWLESRRASFLSAFEGSSNELIDRFALHPTQITASS